MENPILAFRKEKGWSRAEFQRRSGLSYQTLRIIETGATKRLAERTKECLSFVGIGDDIQDRLDLWHEYRLENFRNGLFDRMEG
jgi:transcriptional regulator with XRE-family HTH domain